MSCLEAIIGKITNEYEIPRNGIDQKSWAEGIMNDIKNCEDVHDVFRSRNKPFKRFVEEVLPICRLVGGIESFQNIMITLRAGNQPFDAEVLIDVQTEYIEVVNSREAHLLSKILKVMNQVGVAIGTPGNTPIRILTKDIWKKINHGYEGVYHLLVSFDFDTDIYDISVLITKLQSEFHDQSSFKTIFLYEARSKGIYSL